MHRSFGPRRWNWSKRSAIPRGSLPVFLRLRRSWPRSTVGSGGCWHAKGSHRRAGAIPGSEKKQLQQKESELEAKNKETDRLKSAFEAASDLQKRKPEFAKSAAQFSSQPAETSTKDGLGPVPTFSKKLPNGGTLRIGLLDGNPEDYLRIQPIAQEWTEYANLRFDFLPSAGSLASQAGIHIGLSKGIGSWSYLGMEALKVPDNKPAMNLDISSATAFDVRIAVLREFGHLLGLINENQSPNATIPGTARQCTLTMERCVAGQRR